MSDNIAQLNLKEPEQVDWDNFNPSSKWAPPPPALGVDGKPIIYYGTLPADMSSEKRLGATDEGYLKVECGPITFAKNGNGVDGQQIRFYTVNVKKFVKKDGTPLEVSSAGKLLRSAGIMAKPQKNAEYVLAFKQTAGRPIAFTIDWEARSKDTGEQIKGYENFPIDPKNPARRLAVLERGTLLPDGRIVQAERMFANARIRNVIDKKG